MLLYKYYSPKKHNFDSILNGQFWFASNPTLNDPYDLYSGEILLRQKVTKEEDVQTRIKKIIESYHIDQAGKDIKSEILQFVSCSFSINPIDRLMWAHYADSYKGFCAGFEIDDNLIDNGYCVEDKFHKILYLDQMPFPLSGRGFNFNKNRHLIDDDICYKRYYNLVGLEEAIVEYYQSNPNVLKEYLIQMLCIKAQEWVYEQEFRLISKINTTEIGQLNDWPKGIKLKEIILGNSFILDEEDNGARETLNFLYDVKNKYDEVDFFYLALDDLHHFSLNITPYNLKHNTL